MFNILSKSCSALHKEYKLINYLLFIIVIFNEFDLLLHFVYFNLRGRGK